MCSEIDGKKMKKKKYECAPWKELLTSNLCKQVTGFPNYYYYVLPDYSGKIDDD